MPLPHESKLKAELDRLGLNTRQDDPVKEAERIKSKREYCHTYGLKHHDYLEEALIYATSAGRSSEIFILDGVSVRQARKRGHEVRYGTPSEKQKRWSDLQSAVDHLYKRKPDLSYESICIHVAKQFDYCLKTVKRRTTNPAKNS